MGPRDDGFRIGVSVISTNTLESPVKWKRTDRTGDDLNRWSMVKSKTPAAII